VHGSVWLLPLILRDEQGTSLTQEHLILLKTAILVLYIWAKFSRHTLATSMNRERVDQKLWRLVKQLNDEDIQ